MSEKSPQLKRMPVGSVKLMFAGDLIVAQCSDLSLSGLFKRFKVLFELFANMEKEERFVNYKLMNALMLTSYAKKATDPNVKKDLFDKKNALFFDIANNINQRKKVRFSYLTSKNFRVLEYCPSCIQKNTEAETKKFHWKFCKDCKFDRKFYNVVSMFHKFDDGDACIFLSNDQVEALPMKTFKFQGKLEEVEEEAKYKNFHYSVKNLDAIDLNSVLQMHKKILGK